MKVELQELIRIAKEGSYSSFFATCKDNIPKEELFALFAAEQGTVYRIVYQKFTTDELVALMALFPDLNPDRSGLKERARRILTQYPEREDQISMRVHNLILFPAYTGTASDCDAIEGLLLITRELYQQNRDKAQTLLGMLFVRAPDSVCKKAGMGELSLSMSSKYFMDFLVKQPYDTLPILYFPNFNLFHVLRLHGVEALLYIFNYIVDREYVRLERVLYQSDGKTNLFDKLIQYPGSHQNEVFNLVRDQLKDREKKRIILEHYQKMTATTFISFIKSMSPLARREILLTRLPDFDQTYLIERFAIDVKDKIIDLLNLLVLFEDEDDRYALLTQPIKYAVRKVYASNDMANTAATAFSSFAGMLPGIGRQAQNMVNSLQGEEDVSEYLICHTIRANPALQKNISALVFGLKGAQLVSIFRELDATGVSLLIRMLIHCKNDEIIYTLCDVDYLTSDSDKLIDTKKFELNHLRGELRHHHECNMRVGFIAYLNLYTYIMVRYNESNDQVYKESEKEFVEMIRRLTVNKDNPSLSDVLDQHCRENPVRESWGVGNVKVGTTRHSAARKRMQELSSGEIAEGLIMFKDFIWEKINHSNNESISPLDTLLSEIMRGACEPEKRFELTNV